MDSDAIATTIKTRALAAKHAAIHGGDLLEVGQPEIAILLAAVLDQLIEVNHNLEGLVFAAGDEDQLDAVTR